MSTHKTAKPPAPKLAVESTTVQFPLVDHAVAVGWQPVTPEAALGKRRGEGGLYFYDELEAALLRLNPGVVTPADVPGIVQELDSLPATLAGRSEENTSELTSLMRHQYAVF